MVTFELIKKEGSIYHYEYYPEDVRDKPGTLILDPEKKKLIKREYSKLDYKNMYYLHFVNALTDGNGNLKEKGRAIWL